ncbi:hypothetical protein NTE_00564 [Candidatus Nitrososphaera evergladensis SR1]|jgi:hypothetical protein|uniref:Integral membrane protein n=1 Tax=Candidatus Nitrososphaera evergladensis SR1 TaxID=1459636 RepID=A0A075MNB2_9ARCH|nr:hypothetical protein [Candidatus Nitrososphaera evergladensis]AIF82645.1 hypothetical protein NTE_00564 [Candidatus Nitrososphaera evergladensis SR1]
MYTELMVAGGVFWSITYVLIIRQGFKDKTFGMPLAALCANISWEAIFSMLHPVSPPQLYINYAWFALDAIIVFQFLKYGKKEFFPKFSTAQFYLAFSFGLVMAFFAVLFVTYEFEDWHGAYAAFAQNLMMSVLFIWMFFSRSSDDNSSNSLRGQSFYIALFKMLGTGVSSLAFYLYQPISHGSFLMTYLYVSIFVCDVIYTGLVYQRSRQQKISLLFFGQLLKK